MKRIYEISDDMPIFEKHKLLKRIAKKGEIPEVLNGQDGLDILMYKILGDDYYIVDPVSNKQCNSIVVADIIKHCNYKDKQTRNLRWMFAVCFSILIIRGILDLLGYML